MTAVTVKVMERIIKFTAVCALAYAVIGLPTSVEAATSTGCDGPAGAGVSQPATGSGPVAVVDVRGHGDRVAAIIRNRGHQVMFIEVDGQDAASVAAGIRTAVDQGARVVNVSNALPDGEADYETAVSYANSHGVVVVAAAGNNAGRFPCLPGAIDQVITVGSTGKAFSPTTVDVTAPGPRGTSFASPRVASAVADMLDACPSLTPAKVEELVTATARDGQLRQPAAVTAAAAACAPPAQPEPVPVPVFPACDATPFDWNQVTIGGWTRDGVTVVQVHTRYATGRDARGVPTGHAPLPAGEVEVFRLDGDTWTLVGTGLTWTGPATPGAVYRARLCQPDGASLYTGELPL